MDPDTRPAADFQSTTLPGDPDTSLVVVDAWQSGAAEDAWEAVDGVEEMPYYNWNAPPPARLTSAVTAAVAGQAMRVAATVDGEPQTIADALRAIRQTVWPGARL